MIPLPESTESQWGRIIHADRLQASGVSVTLSAPSAARQEIADRLGLIDLYALRLEVMITNVVGGGVKMVGVVTARVRQKCVVTLEHFDSDVADEFANFFLPGVEDGPPDQESLESDEAWAEPLGDGAFDLAEFAVQQLSLALDPYPRKPDRQMTEAVDAWVAPDDDLPDGRRRPFENLAAKLKRDK